MTKDEALKLALDALEVWRLMHPDTTACAVRIPAIAALAQFLESVKIEDEKKS